MKRFKDLDKYTKLAIIIILIGIIIRFSLAVIYHVSGDACWHLSVGRFIAVNGEIPLFETLGRGEAFWPPPLFHFLVAFMYNIFNVFSSEAANFAIKFVSPIFGSLTLIFSYLIFRKLFDRKISFYSIVFLTFIPIHIDYSVFGYVESALTFFIVLSVYFAMENKVFLSALAAGLSILTKYNGIFIIPLLLYIFYYKNRGNNKLILKKSLQIIFIPALISLPWFIRNYMLLGNPVWPFLNFIFGGIEQASYSSFDFSRLVHINLLIFTYLEFFGVPNGNYQNLFFIRFPFINLVIAGWILATLIFILPFIFSFKFKKILRNNLILWIVPFIFLMLVYVPNVGWAVSRMLLPAFPALAILWGVGFIKSEQRLKKFSRIFKLLIILIISMFVFGEFFKLTFAAHSWNSFKGDFDWIKTNTEKNSVFLAGGQCISYNIDRQTLNPGNSIQKVDYAFVNQDFNLDKRVPMDQDALDEVREKGDMIYENKKTKTKVYKLGTFSP